MREIQAIMRQIASSITYLPCLDEACKSTLIHPIEKKWFISLTLVFVMFMFMFMLLFALGVFDVLAYTDKDLAVPFTWVESDPKLIANPQIVKLHSFDTKASSRN